MCRCLSFCFPNGIVIVRLSVYNHQTEFLEINIHALLIIISPANTQYLVQRKCPVEGIVLISNGLLDQPISHVHFGLGMFQLAPSFSPELLIFENTLWGFHITWGSKHQDYSKELQHPLTPADFPVSLLTRGVFNILLLSLLLWKPALGSLEEDSGRRPGTAPRGWRLKDKLLLNSAWPNSQLNSIWGIFRTPQSFWLNWIFPIL